MKRSNLHKRLPINFLRAKSEIRKPLPYLYPTVQQHRPKVPPEQEPGCKTRQDDLPERPEVPMSTHRRSSNRSHSAELLLLQPFEAIPMRLRSYFAFRKY